MRNHPLITVLALVVFVLVINLLITKLILWVIDSIWHYEANFWITYAIITIVLGAAAGKRKI